MSAPVNIDRAEQIVRLYRSGEYCFDIARIVGVSKATVHRVIALAKSNRAIEPRYRLAVEWTPEMDDALRRASLAGLGLQITAGWLGVCPQVVRRRRDELGLDTGSLGPTPAHLKWLVAQAGEAGTAETVEQGSVHEHAVGNADAPKD
jgi:hypothetical protein